MTGFGAGTARFVDAIFAGETAVLPRRRTAAFDVPTTVAAEFPAAVVPDEMPLDEHALHVARLAAHEALAEAGQPSRHDLGLVLASTKGDLTGVVGAGSGFGQPWRLARRLAASLELGGDVIAVSCACASGLVALAVAARRLQAGQCERVLVLGVDVLYEFVMAGFGSLHALDPVACRPFDAARRGVSLGEGAGAIVLSRHAHESIGVAVLGHGGANDACHVTGPDRQGAGIALAAQRALASASVTSDSIDLVHLHGTATVANDATEAMGLVGLFGGQTPPAFGTKAQTGHTLGAAGILETIATVAALARATVPRNVALEATDVAAGLDLVRSPRALSRATNALKVASGFGGVQAALVLQA
ncbi:MAG TPA: beta-ketoacyl synthase N-terminal-like domain-containing protein [Planctomycetota bacterium]|nr:beta-ketoacyl synthase N-terminal-like domain-containing protein [Planctomycetota bacterium]